MKTVNRINPVDPWAQPGRAADSARLSWKPSAEGLLRIRSRRGEPLFLADWDGALFLHFEVIPDKLQPSVPFELDLFDGRRAFVSLVAFTMRGMRPARSGRIGAWMMRPIATHPFLNVRTYVKGGDGEPGIHFLREWLPNRLACLLGPTVFKLPYRHAWLNYQHEIGTGTIAGEVRSGNAALVYHGTLPRETPLRPCLAGTLDEYLLERYTAFTLRGRIPGFFRIWHRPWAQTPLTMDVTDNSLLADAPGGRFWGADAGYIGANFSPGAKSVWMGRPHRADAGRSSGSWFQIPDRSHLNH